MKASTSYSKHCIVSVCRHLQVIATGQGIVMVTPGDFASDPDRIKLEKIILGEVFDDSLMPYVNREVAPETIIDASAGELMIG